MRLIPLLSAVCLSSLLLRSATIAVGQGAATPAIQASFVNAYDRGPFSLEVTTPLTTVGPLGSPGLIQTFTAASDSTLKCALIKPDPNAPPSQTDTLQMLSDLYTFYTSIGESTAGYPLNDTTACPANSVGTCNYQLFTKDYALFVYSSPITLSVSVADPFYTIWSAAGGAGGSFGVVKGPQTAVTSAVSKVAGTEQPFVSGVIFSYPASSATPSVYGIVEPAFDAYTAANYSSPLGFPTSSVFPVNGTGLMQQNFENGRIQWTATTAPVVLYPVAQVIVNAASSSLNFAAPGATASITASTFDVNGNYAPGRVITWSTTNGTVASVAGNGNSAVVTAVGAGSSSIYATSEGKTSLPLPVTVGSVCCAIGQGAPTPAIGVAFQAAVARNQLAVALPVSSSVVREGTGYIQTLTSATSPTISYTVAEADGSAVAYVLTGSVYAAYLANGGFTGALGYPVSDPLAGPAQQFASGAILAGSPVMVVAAQVAAKWTGLGGVAGSAGQPLASPVSFASYSGASGVSETFAGGNIYGVTSGIVSGQSVAGQSYYSTGPILTRYLALSGPTGALGIPISDVYNAGAGVLLENFEGGYINLQPGASAAVEHYNPRVPALTVSPSVVIPGGTVHVSATGFAPSAPVAFTITGQPGFSVSPASGAFQWDIVVPASAKSAAITIQASASGAAVSATYTITPVAALVPTFALVSGDQQTAAPGSAVAAPVVAVLLDSSGNPLAGAPVTTSASPGAIASAPAVTDAAGRAVVAFRLPPASGVAVGSVSAGGQTVNFSALAAPASVKNFPQFTETGPQTPLATALAALLGYYQNSGVLSSANGPATAASLAQYLTARNGFVLSDTGDSLANPWVAAQFAGAALSVEAATLNHIRDLLNAGEPAILNLNLTINGTASGNSVAAVGVNADGSIAIADPNPALARISLSDYLNGFSAGGKSVTGALASVFSVAPASAVSGTPFTVASVLHAGAVTGSLAGPCTSVGVSGPSGGGVGFQYCDGSQSLYETDFQLNLGAQIADLTGGSSASIPASSPASWGITRSGGQLTVSPLSLSIGAVADSAAFRPAVSPGGLFSIFGSGFSGSPSVKVGGASAQVLASSPFQINAAMPTALAPGMASLQVSGPAGTATATIGVSAVSPGIFMAGSLGAILNSDGTLNSPSNPAIRGQFVSIYCTGLGATASKAGVQSVTAATSVMLNGTAATPSFAGLVAGFVGLYQVNVTIPASLAPGLAGAVAIQQGTQLSNSVPIAVD